MRRSPYHRIPVKVRRRVFGIARALVGIAVLAYILSLLHVEAFQPLGRSRNLLWLATALGCLAANVYVAAWRWQSLLRILGVRERIAPLLRAIYVGAFYNLVLPGQLGGQAIKVMLLGRRSPAMTAIVASVAIDQLIVVVALFGLALVSAAFAPPLAYRAGWLVGFGLVFLASVALLLFSVTPRVQRRLLRRMRRSRFMPDGLRHQTARTWLQLSSYGRHPVALSFAVAQAVLFLLTLAGMAFGLAAAVDIELDFVTIVFVLCLALIAGVAPFTLAGLGTREATFTGVFHLFGVPTATGATFALLWLLLNSLADALGGAMQLWHPRQTGTLERPRPPHRYSGVPPS
ncbi:MAG TPA: lysylphosphatidylglycerol synthase transmembrane domain-containing protein [Candidatus Dormibacteraeota bacterium]|nr:lysylphosphatidylglycerol synthase transmembrane domain-containing protein [Candidatus Dormibacteraeota bacterium]